jgi:hypothetical protein
MSVIREPLYISGDGFLTLKLTQNVGNGPYVLEDTDIHVLFGKIRDSSTGGMFLVTFEMASFSSRRV